MHTHWHCRSGELDDFDEQVFFHFHFYIVILNTSIIIVLVNTSTFTLPSSLSFYKELEEEKLPFSSKGGNDDGWGRFDHIIIIPISIKLLSSSSHCCYQRHYYCHHFPIAASIFSFWPSSSHHSSIVTLQDCWQSLEATTGW